MNPLEIDNEFHFLPLLNSAVFFTAEVINFHGRSTQRADKLQGRICMIMFRQEISYRDENRLLSGAIFNELSESVDTPLSC